MKPFSLRELAPWISRYQGEHLPDDVIAGLIVAVLVLPQSLAYAMLAGLPPQLGLYASIFPVMAYALLGSSMTQAVGPVAITAIMTFSVLSPLAAPGSAQYLALAAILSLLSGLIILVCGSLRLGFLSQLLSRPVISGFISGSAILIIVSQVKFLLGLHLGGAGGWQALVELATHANEANPATLALGGISLLLLFAATRWLAAVLVARGVAAKTAQFIVRVLPLALVITAAVLVAVFDLDLRHGVAVVGTIQDGMVSFHLFVPELSALKLLAVPALTLAFIGMVQNITMAQALAVQRREKVSANRELVGLGLANIVASWSGGMPVGGGLSRSAVNVAAGAHSPLASIVSALAMLLIVALGTHWFARIPLAVLAACIIVAAIGMVDVQAVRKAWSYDRADAYASLGTTLGVLFFGLDQGIAMGIGLSLVTLLVRASSPHIAVIGRIPGSEHFRNIERHGVETIPDVLFLRIDENLFFGNLNAIETRLASELEHAPFTHDVVLILSAVNSIDTTAMEVLTDLNRDLAERGIKLHLAEVKGPVQDRLQRSPLWATLSGQVYLSVNGAFESLAISKATRT
jgi:SulP family sulfate permease